MFWKLIFFSTLVKRSGAEGVLPLFILEFPVWILIFQGSTFGFLSSVVMIYVSISQLSCIGSSLGRQNSCCFGLPGCKLKRLLILYLWGMLAADLNARNPYLYWLVKSTTSILHRNLFKTPAASMPAWLFHFPVLIRGKEWRLWHEWVTRLASCPRTFT